MSLHPARSSREEAMALVPILAFGIGILSPVPLVADPYAPPMGSSPFSDLAFGSTPKPLPPDPAGLGFSISGDNSGDASASAPEDWPHPSQPASPTPAIIPIQPTAMVSVIDPAASIDPTIMPLSPETEAPFPEHIELPESATSADAAVESSHSNGDFSNDISSALRIPGWAGVPQGRPSGFTRSPSAMPYGSDLADALRDGVGLSAFLSGTYETNPSQGYGPAGDAGEGDFHITLGGTATYQSQASEWTFGGAYSGSYNEYFNQTQLSGYNQSANGSINYEGGPLSASLNVGLDFGSGANRYYADIVDQWSVNYGLTGRYRISPKSSVLGNLSQNLTTASENGSSDTGSFNASLSAIWRYSPLTEFGPGISYTKRGGSTQQDLTSIGPIFTTNYKLSSKVALNSTIGLDFSEYEDGQRPDPSFTAAIGLNYRASRLWGMNLSLHRNVEADPGDAGLYQEVTSLSLGYNRRIRSASLNLGMSWQFTSDEAPDTVANSQSDTNHLDFNASIGMPVFADTCDASVFLGYSDQGGGSGSESWDSFQSGFRISRSF